ncbi:glycosyltransferase family 22 protein [Desarmillaria tabescens]|uniref:Mannosyltransferase n=1 Tax=Armillaria tabescens TaxID=1929756 RepID=A0AA39U261_ARMTA|nr:glycosyltransferase family 22 protein [Desarmillaria tabescens]KAK0465555.1 glycosyltransferase family 22 protein [Desarmillaria tabescens]
MSGTTQSIRLRRPQTENATPKPKKQDRHSGILQDQLRRSDRPPWSPSFSLAFRIILLIRVMGAMYSNIDDCDEVFNFWEPLHYFDKGYGFQTWEVSPEYAIRSWTYNDKRPSFFAVRIFLAFISTFCEVILYRQVYEKVNQRVGRYLFFMLAFSAGMWNASTAFLPSSFAMYTSSVAFAYSIAPSSVKGHRKTIVSTIMFATGAIVGWPFALALAVPFVFEEFFVFGADTVPSASYVSWISTRWKRLFGAGVLASLIFVPVVAIDSFAYGKLSVVPWNIVRYNIFSDRGPNLYGTEPWNFYILNLLLNFNVLTPLALLSLPALAVTYAVDRKRLGSTKPRKEESSPFTLLALRLAPFYLWLSILSKQEHKEERFMFPAYPMLCFNAAISVYLIRGWLETAFIKITKSPYRAAHSPIFRSFTSSAVLCSILLSTSRILALWNYYHAPMTLMYALESQEIPTLLNETGLLPTPLPPIGTPKNKKVQQPRIDLSPVKELELTLCIGKFVKSEFDGLLPGHFRESTNDTVGLWPRPETRHIPKDMNDLNREEPSHYVPVSRCDYLMDLDFPSHPSSSPLEPRYSTLTDIWEKIYCKPFLDAHHSPLLSRALWMPGEKWRQLNSWGDFCLLKNRALVEGKVQAVRERREKKN